MNFIEFLKTLRLEDWNKKVTDEWTVRDVVAHMVGWEKESANVIKSIWDNKEKPWFIETENYGGFNKKSVDYYKSYKSEELIKEWEKWQEKVDKEIDQIGEDKLKDCPDLFSWLFEEGEGSHYSKHYKQIKEVTKTM